jgi:hypothetical protein
MENYAADNSAAYGKVELIVLLVEKYMGSNIELLCRLMYRRL